MRLRIDPPRGWRVVNALTAEPEQKVFDLPNYDRLVDTPTEVAPDFQVFTFRVDDCQYRVVTHQLGTGQKAADRYAATSHASCGRRRR